MTISYTSEEERYLNYYRAEEEIPVGIKLTDEQIERAEAAGFRAWEKAGESGESYLWERRYLADAATAKTVREIGKKLEHNLRQATDMTPYCRMNEADWQALLAEAGLAELVGIRIEIDERLKPGEGYLKEAK